MNLFLLGMNHRTAPIEVRERMNIPEARLAEATADLAQREGIREGMILSTCNRIEVVASAADETEAEPAVRSFLSDRHQCDLASYEPYFYRYRQQEVIEHLFRVASSLDSMILGEPQILGQVKRAYEVARQSNALNGPLNEVLEHTFSVAKRVRRETAIGAAAVSVSFAAVELAKKIFGNLQGKAIYVIGAGKMGEVAAKHLLRSGASAVFVSHRTHERAEELAQAFHGTAIRYEEMFMRLAEADIVISSASADDYVVLRDQAEQLLQARRNRPMFFIDIGVPRNIDPSINGLDNAFVYDIDDLGQVVEANKKQREKEAVWAEAIVKEEVEKTVRRLASRELAPTIVALEQQLNRIRENEIERFRGRLAGLSEEERQNVEALTRAMMNKILHGPITELKSVAGRPEHGALVQLIRKIFGVSE